MVRTSLPSHRQSNLYIIMLMQRRGYLLVGSVYVIDQIVVTIETVGLDYEGSLFGPRVIWILSFRTQR